MKSKTGVGNRSHCPLSRNSIKIQEGGVEPYFSTTSLFKVFLRKETLVAFIVNIWNTNPSVCQRKKVLTQRVQLAFSSCIPLMMMSVVWLKPYVNLIHKIEVGYHTQCIVFSEYVYLKSDLTAQLPKCEPDDTVWCLISLDNATKVRVWLY